jgi:predicted metal-binding membrane protein
MASSSGIPAGAFTLRRAAWTVPEWPWIVLVSGAWIALAGHLFHGRRMGEWVVMVVAMMLPATLMTARVISLEGLWARRYRAPAIFLATYIAVWSLFGALALGAWSLVDGRVSAAHETVMVAAILVAASGWQLTGRHRRFLKRCHRTLPIRARGWPADRSCLHFGAYHAGQCIGACWLLMLAMVPAHLPAVMVAVAAVSTWERVARLPRRTACAAVLCALALVTLAL